MKEDRKLRGLYAITPDAVPFDVLEPQVRQALDGGIAALQYRRKDTPASDRRREAAALAHLCRGRCTFIVNDDVELALEVDADGAHLGRTDEALPAARARLGGKLLGSSCYNDLALAKAARAAGADYVAFGSVYASSTKPQAVRAPLSLFSEAQGLGVPLAAIGGITLERAPELIAAGAALLAVISDLFDAPDISLRARQYTRLFQ